MTLILNNVDREELEVALKYSECTTIQELIIKRVTKRLTEHDIFDISFVNSNSELEVDLDI